MPALFLYCSLLSIAEIVLFAYLGMTLGWPTTIGVTLLTSALGLLLLQFRRQFIRNRLSTLLQEGNPGAALPDMALSLMAPWFLVFPGFITDLIGLGLLFRPFRTLTIKLFGVLFNRYLIPKVMSGFSATGAQGFGPGGFGPNGFNAFEDLDEPFPSGSHPGPPAGGSSCPEHITTEEFFRFTPENYAERMAKLRPLLDDIMNAEPLDDDDWDGTEEDLWNESGDEKEDDGIIDVDYEIKKPDR